MTGDRVQTLSSRLDTLQKLDRLELASGVTPADALAQRQLGILQRLERLEAACGVQPGPPHAAAHAGASPAAAQTAAAAAAAAAAEDGPADSSPVQARMAAQLRSRGVAPADVRWVRCPVDYYQRPLEYRVACLGAASTHHLTKIVVMVNTRAPAEVADCSNNLVSKYYAVMVQVRSAVGLIMWRSCGRPGGGAARSRRGSRCGRPAARCRLPTCKLPRPGPQPLSGSDPARRLAALPCPKTLEQYTSRLHTEKLNSIVYRRSQGGLSKKQVNLRLAPEDVSLELTGFGHNAVSPVGMATPIPLVMSHK